MREDGGRAPSPPRGGGGKKPVRQGPPVYSGPGAPPPPRHFTLPKPAGPRQGPPSYSNLPLPAAPVVRTNPSGSWYEAGPKPAFDMGHVSDVEAELKRLLNEKPEADYSAFINPHLLAAQNNDWGVRTPEQAAELRNRRNGGTAEPTIEDRIADTRKNLAEATRAEREQALNGKKPDQHGKVEAMTWEEYEALTPEQRAAVDFNTMLVRAVRRDKNQAGELEPSKKERGRYEDSVNLMFGEEGGSDLYAPETLAVLKQIKFRDTSADLDDFLGLKAAITAKDLANLTTLPGAEPERDLNPVQQNRLELTQNIAESSLQMQKSLAKGNQMLENMRQTAMAERAQDINRLGGDALKPDPSTAGYGGSELDTYFQQAFDVLADTANTADKDEILSTVATDLNRPGEYDQFMRYLDTRSKNAGMYDMKLGSTPEVKYRSPEEFRQLLGLEGAGDGRR